MKGFVGDIEELTEENSDYRRVALHGQESSAGAHVIGPR